MNRRDFLISSTNSLILLGLSPFLSARLAHAEEGADQEFFVQIFIRGGWDVTLGTDPWLGLAPKATDMFLEYDPANIARVGNIAFGPSFEPMKEFAAELSVVNGIFMSPSDNGHEAAEKYIKSGSTEVQWGTLAVEAAETRPIELLGIIANASVAMGQRSLLTTDAYTLQTLIDTGLEIDAFQSNENLRNHLSRMQSLLSKSGDRVEKMRKLASDLTSAGATLTNAHRIAIAFASGTAQIAQIETGYRKLDTHDNHEGEHLTNLKAHWSEVADLIKAFKSIPLNDKGLSVFDRTTFAITSEFARTPALNSSKGKDHNPMTNSMVLIGPRIRGGQTIGGSHLVTAAQSKIAQPYHIASPIDIQTGQALSSKTNATIVRPENVVATVVEALGISRRRFASVSPRVKSLTHLLKK